MPGNNAFLLPLGIVLLLAVNPQRIAAQAGSLDPTFGTSGIVISTVDIFPETAVLDAAGNILIAGTAGVGQPGMITRFLANGPLDTTFGAEGVVTTSIPFQIATMRVEADGAILIGGFTNASQGNEFFALARYTPSGVPDTSFGKGGLVVTAFAPPATGGAAQVVVEQPDGKIVAGGANVSGVVLRYNSDGTLDPGFGNGGVVQVPSDLVVALAIQANGTILVSSAPSLGYEELSSTGVIQPKVAIQDIVAVSRIGGSGAIQKNGDFLIGATIAENTPSQAPTRQEVQIQRYLPAGAPDPSFHSPAFYWQSEPASALDLSFVSSTALFPGGKIVAGGSSTTATATAFALARFNANGSFDTTFGTTGIVTTQILGECGIDELLIQSTGRIVAVGLASSTASPTSYLVLARYLSQ